MCTGWRLSRTDVEAFERDEADGVVLEMTSGEDDYGDLEAWCARIQGVDPDHGWSRIFCTPARVHGGEDGESRVEFELTRVGGYECRAREGAASLYLWFDGTSLCELEPDVMRERVRGGATRVEVDVACQHERWEEAERLAWNIADEAERGDALVAVRARRDARDDSGLMRLLGTPKQRQWARLIREQALARFTAIEGDVIGQESATLARPIDATHLDHAMDTIRTEQRATFWIEMRDALEAHPAVHFIEALVSGERLEIIDDEESD